MKVLPIEPYAAPVVTSDSGCSEAAPSLYPGISAGLMVLLRSGSVSLVIALAVMVAGAAMIRHTTSKKVNPWPVNLQKLPSKLAYEFFDFQPNSADPGEAS